MTLPDPKFRLGSIVFHVTSADPGVVVAYIVYADTVLYRVAWNVSNIEEHREGELTTARPTWDSSIPGNDGLNVSEDED